jgi:hypothetical protein
MDIYDSDGEYLEIYIGMLISSNSITKKIGVIGIHYDDDYEPFTEFGSRMLDGGLDREVELLFNNSVKCVVKLDDVVYIITRKYQSKNKKEGYKTFLYIITPIKK